MIQPATEEQLPGLPEELWGHLREIDPRSHYFKEELTAANDLARESGCRLLTLETIFPPVELEPPQGFSQDVVLQGGVDLKASSLKAVQSLHTTGETINAEARRLVTDSNMAVILCDLRGEMTGQVKSGGPKTEKQQLELDRVFYRDLKFFAEQGHGRNTVSEVPGVFYTKLGGTKSRAFWLPVSAETVFEDTPVVARIADCADSVTSEKALLRRVLDVEK